VPEYQPWKYPRTVAALQREDYEESARAHMPRAEEDGPAKARGANDVIGEQCDGWLIAGCAEWDRRAKRLERMPGAPMRGVCVCVCARYGRAVLAWFQMIT